MDRKIICIALLFSVFTSNAVKANFNSIKNFLHGRESVPKLYMPEQVYSGTEAKLLVAAPNAKKVSLFKSKSSSGNAMYENLSLKLGDDFSEVATEALTEENNYRASFIIPFSEEIENEMYYFEAVVHYEDNGKEILKKASPFGSNANYSGHNGIRVMTAPKDNSGISNFARNMLPGLTGARGSY